ncbi:MAG: hypothetical protein RBU37_15620 [Myxococcota bacterium]|jgi:hypothetical protein|nr:hypothetical protein [Myxococcota bacterium]
MQHLFVTDLYRALEDLLCHRVEALRRSTICAGYERSLRARFEALESLMPGVDCTPIAVAADLVDLAHDGFGAAIFALTEAYRYVPELEPQLRDAALRIQTALVPELDRLRSPHRLEAEAARSNRARLPALRADLCRFPCAEGSTLDDWAESFVESGERLGALALCPSSTDEVVPPEAFDLRAPIMRLLLNMRQGLDDELRIDPSLPRDLEAQIFGFFDELERAQLERYG